MIEIGEIYYVLGSAPVKVLSIHGQNAKVEYLRDVKRSWVGNIRRDIKAGEHIMRKKSSLVDHQTRGKKIENLIQ